VVAAPAVTNSTVHAAGVCVHAVPLLQLLLGTAPVQLPSLKRPWQWQVV
jgi:hypothetical protein